ncbi:MAG: glycogen synthase GlgA [Terracidiphilus sp.]
MQIVFAASECAPYAKSGGLAEAVGTLAPELAKLGHEVSVYLPLYASARRFLEGEQREGEQREGEPKYAVRSITIPFPFYNRFAGIVDGGFREGVRHYFVECPELFDRPELYGPRGGEYGDNAERFGLFCRAVVEAAKQLGVPQIFHVHDWQASLIPVYLRTTYASDPVLSGAGTVLTIHNAGYQGWFPPQTTEQLLFPWDIFTMDRLEHYDRFDFLKGGIVYSDMLTAVSPTYAREIQTSEFGNGLDVVLSRRAADLRGILNGVDYTNWNPATDRHLAAHFTTDDLAGKHECRKDLLHAFGLENVSEIAPVIGIVSRFATQKGFDLLAQVADSLADRNAAVVIMGSGDPYYEHFFRDWIFRHPASVAARFNYDEALAHKVEAGADMFLMPSRYEPCGLNQIYSLKYGAVPIVHATGGLEDTVEEWNGELGTGTGFKFHGYEPRDLLGAVDQALAAFQEKDGWTKLMRNGMAQDFSWEKPAREYAAVYEEVARRRA